MTLIKKEIKDNILVGLYAGESPSAWERDLNLEDGIMGTHDYEVIAEQTEIYFEKLYESIKRIEIYVNEHK